MTRLAKIAIWVFSISLVASVAASFLHERSVAIYLGAPALFFSGWTLAGHIITLDDDFPGGWSNEDGDKAVVFSSLRWLVLKAVVFAAALFVILAWPF